MAETMSLDEIAKAFGVTKRTISNKIKQLRSNGIEVPTKMGRRPVKLT